MANDLILVWFGPVLTIDQRSLLLEQKNLQQGYDVFSFLCWPSGFYAGEWGFSQEVRCHIFSRWGVVLGVGVSSHLPVVLLSQTGLIL